MNRLEFSMSLCTFVAAARSMPTGNIFQFLRPHLPCEALMQTSTFCRKHSSAQWRCQKRLGTTSCSFNNTAPSHPAHTCALPPLCNTTENLELQTTYTEKLAKKTYGGTKGENCKGGELCPAHQISERKIMVYFTLMLPPNAIFSPLFQK